MYYVVHNQCFLSATLVIVADVQRSCNSAIWRFSSTFLGGYGGAGGGVVQKVKGLCHLFDMNVIRKKASFGSSAHRFI